jgi:hypothetical protein
MWAWAVEEIFLLADENLEIRLCFKDGRLENIG